MEKTLTIAIPVYNRSRFFKAALESALNQTVPTPVIVVDNASTEFDFEAFVDSYHSPRLKYYRNPVNLGMAGNWNRCIELCETPYLVILNDDDVLELSYVEQLAECLKEKPVLVGAGVQTIDENGRWMGDFYDKERFRRLETWTFTNPWASPAFSVKDARALGGFPQRTHYYGFDHAFWFRLALRGDYKVINKVLVNYRAYQAEDRATCAFNRQFNLIPLTVIQGKRNRHLLATVHPEIKQPAQISRPGISLKEFLHILPCLSRRRAAYAYAIYLQTRGETFPSRAVRFIFRLGGRPLCLMAAAVVRCLGRMKKIGRKEKESL
jgi:GT2 family glycosyltransferase